MIARILIIFFLIFSQAAYALEIDNDFNGDVDIAYGGTNASTAAGARANLGLGNVDNTSDADKPISTATQAALDLKQPLTQEQVEDYAGAMVTGGTETGIEVTYDDGTGKFSYVVTGGGASVSDTAYEVGWDGDTTTAPSKNAVYDKIESLSVGSGNPTSLGLGASDPDFGTFTGSLLLDNQTAKQLFQAIETEMADTVSISTNGLIARTGDGTAAARTITAGDSITVADGDGVSGNPTISVTLDASGFNGNLATTDDTVQEIAQKLDDLSTGSISAYESGTEADFHIPILNPQGVYDNDSTNHAVDCITYVPAAMTINAFRLNCDIDPTAEITISFYKKTWGIGYASSTLIEAVTTTAGTAFIDSGIDSPGLTAGQMVYAVLSDPDDSLTKVSVTIFGTWN